jgi:glycosyltransferase involved in cell wall biosynthesis
MEWIVLDDGNDNLGEIIPRDKRVKYYHLENKLSLSNKRNKLVELASNDIIVFMDDDDFYPPESILARVKSLLKYEKKGVKCVGCIDVANYDIKKQSCALGSNGSSYFCESSLAFYKSFWIERPFKSDIHCSEYRHFLEYRQDQLRNIPFQFITISLYHGKNTTGEVRASRNNSSIDKKKILEIFGDDMDFLNFLNKIQNK